MISDLLRLHQNSLNCLCLADERPEIKGKRIGKQPDNDPVNEHQGIAAPVADDWLSFVGDINSDAVVIDVEGHNAQDECDNEADNNIRGLAELGREIAETVRPHQEPPDPANTELRCKSGDRISQLKLHFRWDEEALQHPEGHKVPHRAEGKVPDYRTDKHAKTGLAITVRPVLGNRNGQDIEDDNGVEPTQGDVQIHDHLPLRCPGREVGVNQEQVADKSHNGAEAQVAQHP